MNMKTPLYDAHLASGGKIVSYGGFLMPVQYETGIIAEHMAVRKKAGLFDVSHMGEFSLKGDNALANLQNLLTNDFSNMIIGQCRYSPMCNNQGGIIDDLLVYKMADDDYLLVVNASNRGKDYQWILSNLDGEVEFEDISYLAQLALQGPLAINILQNFVERGSLPEKYYTFNRDVQIAGVPCLVSKTGYTGEDGYEIYCHPENVRILWDELLSFGRPQGLIPCGLGARDTLRLEAGMPLYGHEMSENITPMEAGLGFFVKMTKDSFIGKQALEELGKPKRQRIGLKLIDRGIAREKSDILSSDEVIVGETTSGTHCPYLGYAVAMGLIANDYAQIGQEVYIDVRGRKLKAEVVKLPFYKKGS